MTIQDIQAKLATINYETLWPGFHSYPFALYNRHEVFLADRTIAWDDRFRGNTSIEFEGGYLAIWNIEQGDFGLDPLQLYPLVHEMFHCFQRDNQEKRFPDDLTMLLTPDDPIFYALRARETELLYEAFLASEEKQKDLFYQFAAARQTLLDTYPSLVKQICIAETLEGSAEYVGLKALAQLSPMAYAQQICHHLNKLNQPEMLFDIRRLTYFTGALTLILAEKLEIPWDHSIQGQTQSNFELIFPHQEAAEDAIDVPPYLTEVMQSKRQMLKAKIESVEKKAQYIPLNRETTICGYDPMNMQRLGDKVYCAHFVFLSSGYDFLKLEGETVLNMQPGSPNTVNAYTKQ